MSRGGCSDHGLAGRVLCAEYRLLHACVLSSTDRESAGFEKPQTSVHKSGMDTGPKSGVEPGGVRK